MDIAFLAIFLYCCIVACLNLLALFVPSYPSLPMSDGSGIPKPLVSIIVPTRNEEDTIRDCLDSLSSLEYTNKEIILVDGGSSDRTLEIVAEFSNVKLLPEPALPAGWVGKNWACQTGFRNASGEVLLFTDGDTKHSRDSLTSSVAYLQSNNLDMVTILPRVIAKGLWENTILPLVFQVIFFTTGGNRANNEKSSRYMGNGQYLLVRREAYEKIGGHETVRSRIDEDYRMGQAVKKAGLKMRILLGPSFLQTRMYTSFREMWEGWTKNVYAGANYRANWFLLAILLIFLLLFFPYLIMLYGLLEVYASWSNTSLLSGLLASGAITLRSAIMNRRWMFKARYAIAEPVSVAVFIAIMIASMLGYSAGRGIAWKGRSYHYANGKLT